MIPLNDRGPQLRKRLYTLFIAAIRRICAAMGIHEPALAVEVQELMGGGNTGAFPEDVFHIFGDGLGIEAGRLDR
jgi:hypothetical protein